MLEERTDSLKRRRKARNAKGSPRASRQKPRRAFTCRGIFLTTRHVLQALWRDWRVCAIRAAALMLWPALLGAAFLCYQSGGRDGNGKPSGRWPGPTATSAPTRPGGVERRQGTGALIPPRHPGPLNDAEASVPGDRVVSRPHIHAAACGSGLVNKYYHRFENVHLTRRALTVYYAPDFEPPEGEMWVDIVTGNSTRPALPTMLVLKGDMQTKLWYWLPVRYLPAAEHQPRCASWVAPPTFLLQARYSYNIWHTWNEGLMGIFQTLRELGYLPLADIGAGGRMEEILDGMGGGCAWEYDPGQGRVVRPESCEPREGLLGRDRCDPGAEAWCREGSVVSARRHAGGPAILAFTPESVANVWGHLYSAMSTDVRQWGEVEGACFRNLIVGKTPTLNFYQAVSAPPTDPAALEAHPRVDVGAARMEAMAVFKAFVTSAQREWVEAQEASGAPRWGGYRSAGLERLRRGLGPEDAGDEEALSSINPKEVPGMLREELDDLRGYADRRAAWVEPGLQRYREQYGGAKAAREAARLQGLDALDHYEDYEALAVRVESGRRGAQGQGDTVEAQRQSAARGRRQRQRQQPTPKLTQHAQQAYANEQQQQQQRRQLRSDLNGGGQNLGRTSGGGQAIRGSPPAQPTPLRRPWFDRHAVFSHERPRPVVTYMSRNFFSRGVLNERDILSYVLQRYNVTLRVTTFEEPLLEVMQLLGASDVVFGMHGAGWTNLLFVKRGATTQQLFPFGWRLPDNSTVRGFNYREIVLASECPYSEWVSPHRHLAFLRRLDYPKQRNLTFSLHPHPAWPLPRDSWPGNPWVYQNTYVDMEHYGPYIDAMMRQAGIEAMQGWR